MRVAITTGHLSIPPTYFVTQHAERLVEEHRFAAFPLVARVRDASVGVPIRAAVPEVAPWSAARYLAAVAGRRQARLVTGFAPDIVHQHFATWAEHALDAAEAVSAPAIVTIHGYDVFEALSPRGGLLGGLHARSVGAARARATRTLAVSEYLASLAVAAGWPSERLEVHHQGVDTDFFVPRTFVETAEAEPVVAFVGALSRGKGVLDLAAASIDAHARAPHRLRIAGSGPLRQELEAAARSHPHIELLGPIDRSGVRALLQSSRVFALPAQAEAGRREAAGLVLLEAQACGVPVLATASGGVPEMLRPDVTGKLVPEGDAPALGAALGELLRLSGTEWERVSRAARDFVVTQRSVAAGARVLAEHYAELSGD